MPSKPTKTDPQYPFLSECVKGSALVETPNGIARDMGLSPDQLTLGARNDKGLPDNVFGKIVTRRSTDDMATGNRSGE
jgi:hypothetical protein